MRVILKLGIYYIVQGMAVDSEQIRFHQKEQSRSRRRASEPSVCPCMSGGESNRNRMGILFRVGFIRLWDRSEGDLSVRF